ncbi:MAG: FtsX-like permease family protein [Gemmatimonas sp.]|nr:FtsX-like permease family protein [Gemmatimonas sp.]
MVLVGALGAAAALLAALGIHGLISSLVSERLRELGVRMALGASVEQAMRTVMLPGIVLTLVGLAVGSVLALGAAGLVRRLLWGVTPTDPLTFAGVAVTLLVVAIVASLVPALRVRRVDPAMLLRE